ncbi:MAG TPA: class 1 fructose-bisphosphatase [Candidatus Polarisedimenticolia bacterium]|nr:class 1 fructose-bisphosphatase [Candidatus Polarisedimenticolia bacterium]
MSPGVSFDKFLAESSSDRELIVVLLTAARGGAQISRELRRAGLSGETGLTGGTNVQGEAVKKMDAISNEILVGAYRDAGDAAMAASEEMEEPVEISRSASYAVLFDPLDGSSNVDTGGSVGSIVSVQRRPAAGWTGRDSLLQPGTAQAAALYLNYGPATALAVTLGAGTHLFQQDPASGDFLLTGRDHRIPDRGKVYATNEGQRAYLHPSTSRLLEFLQAPDKAEGTPYSTRYSGCMVSDVHRILLEGGIFFYPADRKDPKKPQGKLRLLYECAPMAMIVEQAGGMASTGKGRLLEARPTKIHERVPIYIGSRHEVSLAEAFETGRR